MFSKIQTLIILLIVLVLACEGFFEQYSIKTYLNVYVILEIMSFEGTSEQAASIEIFELHVWPGEWDLPSLDPECLTALLINFSFF